MPVIEGTYKVGGGYVGGRPRAATGSYDFAVDGGLVSAIPLRGDSIIPSGAVVTDALLRVTTAPVGGTVTDTLSVGAEAAADVQAAAARNAAPWATTGAKRVTLTATAAPILTTAARTLTFTINGSALTAGVFTVVVWYVELG